jgi:membrane protein DedA with SNARE-associated domain
MLILGVIAVSVIIENFFPPSPSDVFVVLAAFLTHRGTMEPLTIFLVAWGFGVGGAVLVYWASRRFGRRFFHSRLGRRVISPGAFAAIEREYLRFGMLGMFIFRLLPAFRSVVAPFAGFVNLPPGRTLLPIVLATGTWYAALTLLGTKVGSEWETINATLRRLNTGLGIAAAILLLALAIWFQRRRKAARRARIEELEPFDPMHPERAVPMVEGLPDISGADLEAARRQRTARNPGP